MQQCLFLVNAVGKNTPQVTLGMSAINAAIAFAPFVSRAIKDVMVQATNAASARLGR